MNEKYRIVYAVPPQGGARVAEIWEDGRRLCALPGYIEGTLDGLIADANNAADSEELRDRIKELEESDEADELQSRVDELESEKDDLNDEIEKLKKENDDLNDKVEELEGEIDKLKNGLEGE